MIDETLARQNLYAFFSRLFIHEIDDAFADFLNKEMARELLPKFAASAEELEVLSDKEKREAHFHSDYAHLTMVNLVPYESFYRRDDAMIESGFANPVVQFYQKYGFEVDLEAARALSPDHLGIELEFMAALIGKEYEARQEGQLEYADHIQKIELLFLDEHLMRWAIHYLLAVADNAKTVLYAEGAKALLEFLLTDYEHLKRD
ncbi:MAG: molecular chaperone TorD family protein [Campylobacterales bacterium]